MSWIGSITQGCTHTQRPSLSMAIYASRSIPIGTISHTCQTRLSLIHAYFRSFWKKWTLRYFLMYWTKIEEGETKPEKKRMEQFGVMCKYIDQALVDIRRLARLLIFMVYNVSCKRLCTKFKLKLNIYIYSEFERNYTYIGYFRKLHSVTFCLVFYLVLRSTKNY